MGTSLYVLTEQYRELERLSDSETDIPLEVLQDTLEGLTGELTIKAGNVARFIASQEAMAEAIDDASKAMALRAKRLRSRMDYLRDYLLMNLQAAGIPKLESPELVVKVQKNPPRVVVTDEALVPADFKVTPPPAPPPEPRVDKKLVGDALKAGMPVPGCHLEQGMRLVITP